MPDSDSATSLFVERRVTVCNRRGLHARASARFVQTAEQFDAEITVAKDDLAVCATSIMGLMMLAASDGQIILLKATGHEATQAVEALANLVTGKFGED